MNKFSITLLSFAMIFGTVSAQERDPAQAGVQSGRYQIPKSLPSKKVDEKISVNSNDQSKLNLAEQPVIVLKKDTAKKETKKASKAKPGSSVPVSTPTAQIQSQTPPVVSPDKSTVDSSNIPLAVENLVVKPVVEPTNDNSTSAVPVPEPSPTFTEQIKTLVSGETTTFVDKYTEQVHPDDNRLNQIELSVGAGLFYNDNKSNYSFRNFQSYSPTYYFSGQVWITPLLGISLKQNSSVGADVSIAPSSRSSVQYDWSELKFDYRKFYGLSRRANSVVYSLYYFENKFSPPGDSSDRVKTKSSGLGVAAKIRIPESPHFSWIYGVKFAPRVAHSESATGIDLSSGDKGDSSVFGMSVGGEIKMNRENRFHWDTGFNLERNQFKGTANLQDPETGSSPNGVSVTNTTIQFNFGYTWGQ